VAVKQWAMNERREVDKFRGHLAGTGPAMPRWFRHIRSVVEQSKAVAPTSGVVLRCIGDAVTPASAALPR
jgi:hypothetical protein